MAGYIASSGGIDRAAWLALISQHDALHPAASRVGINPFTGERTEFKAPKTTASLIIEGERAGVISWAEDGSRKLIVDVPDARAEPIVHNVASALDA